MCWDESEGEHESESESETWCQYFKDLYHRLPQPKAEMLRAALKMISSSSSDPSSSTCADTVADRIAKMISEFGESNWKESDHDDVVLGSVLATARLHYRSYLSSSRCATQASQTFLMSRDDWVLTIPSSLESLLQGSFVSSRITLRDFLMDSNRYEVKQTSLPLFNIFPQFYATSSTGEVLRFLQTLSTPTIHEIIEAANFFLERIGRYSAKGSGNQLWVDCCEPNPEWVSINLGVMMCIALDACWDEDCKVGVVKDYEFLCPSGEGLVISCNGSTSGRGRRHCPMTSLLTLCEAKVQSTSSPNQRSFSCVYSPFQSNESVTTCFWNLSAMESMRDNSGPVSFSLLSIEKSVVTEFVSTWETAPSLSSEDVTDSWMVLVTVGTLGISFVVLVLLSIQSDKHQSKLVSSIEIETKQNGRGSVNNSLENFDKKNERKLIEEALPTIFKADSLWIKFKEEMRIDESAVSVLEHRDHALRPVCDLEDGSCETCDDERCCMSLRSTLNGREHRCYWDSSGEWMNTTSNIVGSCHFREIGGDMTRMFIVAMISAILSAPLVLSVQYLIMNVLSKECVSDEELEKEKQRASLKRLDRWSIRRVDTGVSPLSLISLELVESCGRTLLDDLNNLLKELSAHFIALKEDLAKEFRNTWGSLVDERSQEDRSKLLVIPSHLERMISRFSLSDRQHQHQEVTTDLLIELGKVRNEVFREYHWLEGLRGAEMDLMTVIKRRRLLFLFVKDLSSGISGDVLSNKSQRDSKLSRAGTGSVSSKMDRVSWMLKGWSWLFVVVLDGGMLLYVYFFAMNQTHSRQKAWFISFVMWLGFEIFLSSTALVLVLHLLIPLYVWSDVSEVKQKVLKDLMKFREKYLKRTLIKNDLESGADGKVGDSKEAFNAAKYLYPSWRVASLLPSLPESQLVLQFSTPWPKKRFGKEEGNVAKEYEDDVVEAAASNILLYFLASLLHYSSLVQDIFIQTLCNGGLGYLLVMLVRIWNVYPWLAAVVLLSLVMCAYFVGRISLSSLAKKLKDRAAEPEDVPENSREEEKTSMNQAVDSPRRGPLPQVEVLSSDSDGSVRSEGEGSFRACIWESDDSSSSRGAPSRSPFVFGSRSSDSVGGSDISRDVTDSEVEGGSVELRGISQDWLEEVYC